MASEANRNDYYSTYNLKTGLPNPTGGLTIQNLNLGKTSQHTGVAWFNSRASEANRTDYYFTYNL